MPEQHFYLAKLMGFQYEIVYRSGKSNVVVDALSKQGESENVLNTLLTVENPLIIALQQANLELEELLKLKRKCSTNELGFRHSVKDNMMYFEDKLVVPNIKELKYQILTTFHAITKADQGGILKRNKAISEVFHWNGCGGVC